MLPKGLISLITKLSTGWLLVLAKTTTGKVVELRKRQVSGKMDIFTNFIRPYDDLINQFTQTTRFVVTTG